MALTPEQQFANIVTELESIQQSSTARDGDSVTGGDALTSMLIRQAQNNVTRTPFVMTTTEWQIQSPPRALIWSANPTDISWSMPQRSSHSKNLVGTVLHVWPDPKRQTFFDEIKITLRMQSGSLIPVNNTVNSYTVEPGGVSVLANKGVGPFRPDWRPPAGIANFYDFMQLVDAPKLTSEAIPRANLVYIQYTSNIFPKLTLMGMFEPSGIQFTDDSSNPNQVVGWTAEFLVYDTFPKLSNNTSSTLSNAELLGRWIDEKIKKSKL